MSLRVVVPPHPLIAHWLTVLRDGSTPSPLVAAAMRAIGDRPLPCLVGLSAAGSVVAVEPLPAAVAQVSAILDRWGVK